MKLASLAARGKLCPQRTHPEYRLGSMRPLVALSPTGAGERLLHSRTRQYTERAWHTRLKRDLLDAARRLGAHEVLMVGLTADHGAKTSAPIEARGGRVPRGERQHKGPGNVERLYVA